MRLSGLSTDINKLGAGLGLTRWGWISWAMKRLRQRRIARLVLPALDTNGTITEAGKEPHGRDYVWVNSAHNGSTTMNNAYRE